MGWLRRNSRSWDIPLDIWYEVVAGLMTISARSGRRRKEKKEKIG
jgi:hypothetical protein